MTRRKGLLPSPIIHRIYGKVEGIDHWVATYYLAENRQAAMIVCQLLESTGAFEATKVEEENRYLGREESG